MCTLTIIPWKDPERQLAGLAPQRAGVRVLCNRDESRLRAPARPPEARQFGARQALLPIDPSSDGTWIAVSDAPLVLVLMNVYAGNGPGAPVAIQSPSTLPKVSRGRIIPTILPASDLIAASALAQSLDHDRFEPFRLVIVDRTRYTVCTWTQGKFLAEGARPLEQPLFFTSSGFGEIADARRQLFAEMFGQGHDWPASQDAFHQHHWSGNRRASVWMTRDEACTVSTSEVELHSNRVTMRYRGRTGDEPDAWQPSIELPIE